MKLLTLIVLNFFLIIYESQARDRSLHISDKPYESEKASQFPLYPRDVDESFYEGVNMSPKSFFGPNFFTETQKESVKPITHKTKTSVKVQIFLPQIQNFTGEGFSEGRAIQEFTFVNKKKTHLVKRKTRKKVTKKPRELPPLKIPPHIAKKENDGVHSPDKENGFFSLPSLNFSLNAQAEEFDDSPKHKPKKYVDPSYAKRLTHLTQW